MVAAGVAGGRVGGTESNLAVQLKCYRNARSSISRTRATTAGEAGRRPPLCRPCPPLPAPALLSAPSLLCGPSVPLHAQSHRPPGMADTSLRTSLCLCRQPRPRTNSARPCQQGPGRRRGGGGEPGPERRPTIGATMLRRRCFGGGRLSWAQRSPCGNGGGRRPPTASPPTARPVPSVQRLRTTPPRRGGRTCPAVRRQRRASSPRRSAPAGPKWTRTALPPAHALAAPNWHTGTASRGAPPDEGRAAPAVVTRRPALAAPSPECTVLLAYPAPQPRPRSPVFPRQTP